jgi:hypothetical protein
LNVSVVPADSPIALNLTVTRVNVPEGKLEMEPAAKLICPAELLKLFSNWMVKAVPAVTLITWRIAGSKFR